MNVKSFHVTGIVTIIALIFMSFTSLEAYAASSDTQKYLEASKAARDGDYTTAKTLLEEILKTSDDSDLLLKVDEKLTEVLDKLKESLLPKVPGVYAQKSNGSLVKLNKEPVAIAGLMKNGATTLADALGAPRVRFILSLSTIEFSADDVTSFIVYNPNIASAAECNCEYLKTIKPNERKWVDAPEASQGKTKYVLYAEWSDVLADKSEFTNDAIIKEKIGEGMYKLAFPQKYIPQSARQLAITDGSDYAYPLILNPSTATMIYDRYISKGDASDEALKAIQTAVSEKSSEPLLTDALSLTYIRRGQYDLAVQTAEKTVKLAEKTNHAELDNFKKRLGQAEAGKMLADVTLNYMNDESKYAEGLKIIERAEQKDPESAEVPYVASQLHRKWNKYSLASESALKAWNMAKANRLQVTEEYESHFHQLKCDQLIDEVTAECLDGGAGNADQCIEKMQEALKHVKNYYKANYTLAHVYEYSGKIKDAVNAAKKAAKDSEKHEPEMTAAYYHYLASLYAKNSDIKNAVKSEQKAIEQAGKNNTDTSEYQVKLEEYEKSK